MLIKEYEYGGDDDEMTMLATKWVMRKTFATCCRILQGLTVLRQVDVDLRKE